MTVTSNPLDALLGIRNGDETARWNFPDAVGSSTNAPAGIGHAVSLTYSFPTAAPSYDPNATFQAFNDTQKAAMRLMLASISEVVDVGFVETSGPSQLSYGFNSQAPGTGGYAYLPSYGYSFNGTQILSVTESDLAGDVWLSSNAYAGDDFTRSSDAYLTLLHETGHALGLKHPFDPGAEGFTLTTALDNAASTVMSYTAAPRSTLLSVSGTAQSYSYVSYQLAPDTLMPFDITALQFLYGANDTTRAGNDVYQWATSEELLETIWDAGGTDAIDCANQSLRCVINLNAGSYSSIGLRQTPAEIAAALDVPDFFDLALLPADLYNGSNNLAIASGVKIENATGGSAADQITGNALANLLDGGAGADRLLGGAGNDTYVIDNAGDVVVEAAGGGTDQINLSVNYSLPVNVEAGRITGAGAIRLTGNGAANTLYAGTGSNVLNGAAGTDTVSYLYAPAAVQVSLLLASAQATGGSGSDTLQGIENLTGSLFNDVLTGSAGNNVLKGLEGRDSLSGGTGGDLLAGGLALDKLLGGAGKDIFRFDTAPDSTTNRDTIVDFSVLDDSIQLENAVFTALGATGILSASMFRAGAGVTTAGDSSDHVIYNRTTGALYYDADGIGGQGSVQFAKLSAGLALTPADFLIT